MLMSILRSLVLSAIVCAVQYAVKLTLDDRGGASGSSGATTSTKHRRTAEACIQAVRADDHPRPSLDAIGGLEDIKAQVRDTVILALRYPKVFFSPSAPMLSTAQRLLLCGPPGTGKTMLARAIAHESGVTFMSVTLSTLEDKYFGETPKIMRALFDTATQRAPTVLFFDEIDGIMRTRRDDDQGCVYGMKTEFLQLCDRLQPSTPVVLIGCTNNESSLDPALRRRFPTVYRMGLPSEADRQSILEQIVRDDCVEPGVLRQVAQHTQGATGSRLHDGYRQACAARLRRGLASLRLDATTTARELVDHLPPLSLADWQAALVPPTVAPTTVAEGEATTTVAEETHAGADDDDEALPP